MLKFSCEKSLLQAAAATASRVVATKSSIPALEGLLLEASLEGGVRITGATSYLMGEEDNGYGLIITQRAVDVLPGDTPVTLSDRIMRQAEWPVLTEAVGLFCAGALTVENGRVRIAAPDAETEAPPPPFVCVIREVTEDARYTNASFARKIPYDDI